MLAALACNYRCRLADISIMVLHVCIMKRVAAAIPQYGNCYCEFHSLMSCAQQYMLHISLYLAGP